MLARRQFAARGLSAFALPSLGLARRGLAAFPVTLSADEWGARLTPAQFAILREEATERAFSNSLMGESSPLLRESRKGTYRCGGCDAPVYPSSTKYDSGTGWPSFWDALPGAIGTRDDPGAFGSRTEVHCATCGGHLGHVFDDGPDPTGKRHCLNGLALTFTPA
ncbi:MAG: peptide-methionine (R)-S-oxide reductase MsrB [Gemmobacter sp.]